MALITAAIGRPERGLLALAKGGGADAFEQLIRAHERNVFRLAWRLLGNADDAAEVAQDVFLRLHRSLSAIDEERDLGPWLYRVTANAATDVLRKRRSAATLDGVSVISPAATPEQAFAREERRALASRALNLLPPKERAALVLRDIEGLSTAEVAGALGSSETTVRSQISSARVKLKRLVEELSTRKKP